MTKLSILDLVRIPDGLDAKAALDSARELAAAAEGWGYHRYWVSEHHNMPGIASAATSVVLAHIAAGTERIRVGAGGIMLPNHAPLIIAEHFGTLACLFPGRIDLGVGRADGSIDRFTASALRRPTFADSFPDDVYELQAYFANDAATQVVQAIPAAGTKVPLWILGTSTFGARLAATLGLPYSFGSHLMPEHMMEAISTYRTHFTPSAQLKKPYVMVGLNVTAADTDDEAKVLVSTRQMSVVDVIRGHLGPSRPPIEDMDSFWSPSEKVLTRRMLRLSIVGSPLTVREGVESLLAETKADEIITVTDIHDQRARLRSHEIVAQCLSTLAS